MPLILLVIALVGFWMGGSFWGDYRDATHVRELTCAEFYQHPVISGYVKITDCRVLRVQADIFGNEKTGKVTGAFSPVRPKEGTVDKIRLMMRESASISLGFWRSRTYATTSFTSLRW